MLCPLSWLLPRPFSAFNSWPRRSAPTWRCSRSWLSSCSVTPVHFWALFSRSFMLWMLGWLWWYTTSSFTRPSVCTAPGRTPAPSLVKWFWMVTRSGLHFQHGTTLVGLLAAHLALGLLYVPLTCFRTQIFSGLGAKNGRFKLRAQV
jgi:hypothetical protein